MNWYSEMYQAQIYDTSWFSYTNWTVMGYPGWFLCMRTFQISVFAAAFGIGGMLSLASALLSFVAFHFPIDSQFLPFDNSLVPLILFVLTLAPFGDPLSEERARQSIILVLGLAYLGAAISKLHYTGWEWANGETLRAYLFERYIVTGNVRTLNVAGSSLVCQALCVFTLIFEFTFWAVAFVPRLAWVLVPAGIAGHLLAYHLMRVNFLHFFLITYLIFLVARQETPSKPANKTT